MSQSMSMNNGSEIRRDDTALLDGVMEQNLDGSWSEAKPLPFYDGLIIHVIKRFCGLVITLFYRVRGGLDQDPTPFQCWCRSGEFIGWD